MEENTELWVGHIIEVTTVHGQPGFSQYNGNNFAWVERTELDSGMKTKKEGT